MIGVKVRQEIVLIAQRGDETDYFTLDGIYIGTIIDGVRESKEPQVRPKGKGSVIKSLTPEQLKRQEQAQVAEETGYDERTPDTKKLAANAVRRD